MKTILLVAGLGLAFIALRSRGSSVAAPGFSGGVSGTSSPTLGPSGGTEDTYGSGIQGSSPPLALGMNSISPRMTIQPVAPGSASPDSASMVDGGSMFHPLNY